MTLGVVRSISTCFGSPLTPAKPSDMMPVECLLVVAADV